MRQLVYLYLGLGYVTAPLNQIHSDAPKAYKTSVSWDYWSLKLSPRVLSPIRSVGAAFREK